MKLDKYRMFIERKLKPCVCDGLWFPHRYGCKRCNYRDEGKKWADELNDEKF